LSSSLNPDHLALSPRYLGETLESTKPSESGSARDIVNTYFGAAPGIWSLN
jgi:hypothetical protein